MQINNIRTDNILRAAAEVSKAQEQYGKHVVWFDKQQKEHDKFKQLLEDSKEKLSYALRKLEDATQ